jgi:hypothetical protein
MIRSNPHYFWKLDRIWISIKVKIPEPVEAQNRAVEGRGCPKWSLEVVADTDSHNFEEELDTDPDPH